MDNRTYTPPEANSEAQWSPRTDASEERKLYHPPAQVDQDILSEHIGQLNADMELGRRELKDAYKSMSPQQQEAFKVRIALARRLGAETVTEGERYRRYVDLAQLALREISQEQQNGGAAVFEDSSATAGSIRKGFDKFSQADSNQDAEQNLGPNEILAQEMNMTFDQLRQAYRAMSPEDRNAFNDRLNTAREISRTGKVTERQPAERYVAMAESAIGPVDQESPLAGETGRKYSREMLQRLLDRPSGQ